MNKIDFTNKTGIVLVIGHEWIMGHWRVIIEDVKDNGILVQNIDLSTPQFYSYEMLYHHFKNEWLAYDPCNRKP